MNSVWLLFWDEYGASPLDRCPMVISAHSTEQSAKNAERFFRSYDTRWKPHSEQETWIQEVDFEV